MAGPTEVRTAVRHPQGITVGWRSAESELHKGNRNIGQKSDRNTHGSGARCGVGQRGGVDLFMRPCHQGALSEDLPSSTHYIL